MTGCSAGDRSRGSDSGVDAVATAPANEIPPPQLTEQEARQVPGEGAMYYGTKLVGASSDKAKKAFNFQVSPFAVAQQ